MGQSKSKVSGESVGLAFVVLGLMFGYWLEEAFGPATNYVAGVLTLFGLLGIMVEAQKRLKEKPYRFDSGGVGILFIVPGVYFANVIHQSWTGAGRGIALAALAVCLLIGLVGLFDLIVSIFESNKIGNLRQKTTELLKFITLCATTGAALIAAVRQLYS